MPAAAARPHTQRRPRAALQLLAALFGLVCALPVAQADDIELYFNQTSATDQPPMTVLTLDLNVDGTVVLCDNVVLGGLQQCDLMRDGLTVGNFLSTLNITTAQAQDRVNALGFPFNSVNVADFLATKLKDVSGLTQIVADLIFTASEKLVNNRSLLAGSLRDILNTLVDSRVAILISHRNKGGSAANTCTFADQAAVPLTRAETVACSNGGYFFLGFKDLSNPVELANVLAKITTLTTDGLTATASVAHPYQGKELYDELVRYLRGDDIFNAHLGYYDYGDENAVTNLNNTVALSALSWDTSVEAQPASDPVGENYRSALEDFGTCDSVNVLNIQLTNSAQDSDSDADLSANFNRPDVDGNGSITFPELASAAGSEGFFYNNGVVKLRSYFLIAQGLADVTSLSATGANVVTYSSLLGLFQLGRSTAEALTPVLVVDASLLTPSLTIDITSPNLIREDAFFSGFKPLDDQKVAWNGNLKKLKLRETTPGNGFKYYDANGREAIAADGRIRDSALTFWTNPAQLGLRSTDGRDVTLGGAGRAIPGFGASPGRVNTDGQRQLYYDSYPAGAPVITDINADSATVRSDLATDLGATARTYQDPPGCSVSPPICTTPAPVCVTPAPVCTTPAPICTTVLGITTCVPQLPVCTTPAPVCTTPAPICVPGPVCTTGTYTADDNAKELLLHARGYNVGSTAAPVSNLATVTARPWIHGAVLHSRPVAINYGGSGTPDVRVIYGSTDGWVRMVKNSTGVESWGFMPRAVMRQQQTLRDNQPGAVFPYGVDGAMTAIVIDRDPSGNAGDGKIESGNNNDHAYVFFGLRRGGAGYYGLDVTNPNAAPKLMWRIGTDGVHNSNGLVSGSGAWFSELGLSFSTPQSARIRYKDGSVTKDRRVLVFGGGYHGGRDAANARLGKDLQRGSAGQTGSNDSVGNALYMVDALTGELIWKGIKGSGTSYATSLRAYRHPLLEDSIPSDVSIADTNGDGYADRLYVGDTGGRLWRADFPTDDRSLWSLTPLASVGRHDSASVANDRRFFHAPDFVSIRGQEGSYDAVIFASGDREDPLNLTGENWLYAFRDPDMISGKLDSEILVTEGVLKHQNDFTDLTSTCGNASASTCADNSDLTTGWRLQLGDTGEKGLSQPFTLGGTVFLTSFVPPGADADACIPSEGGGKLYAVNLKNARANLQELSSDGDGDNRTKRIAAAGLAGEIAPVNAGAITSGTENLSTLARRYYDIYWRERRGDDERPVAQ